MEFIEVSAKTLSDAITDACQKLGVPSDRLHYEVIEEGSNGFLGIGAKPAVIKAAIKSEEEAVEKPVDKKAEKVAEKKVEKKAQEKTQESAEKIVEKPVENTSKKVDAASVENAAKTFLKDVFQAMKMEVAVVAKYDEKENNLDIDLAGDEMAILIGKRGQTLDSLQYLVSLVVNKDVDNYIRVKVDTENYRERRKETLENLARNKAHRVKKTNRAVILEPMNPYERRIIHSALQNDKYVTTHSEGEEPYRKVVITLKR